MITGSSCLLVVGWMLWDHVITFRPSMDIGDYCKDAELSIYVEWAENMDTFKAEWKLALIPNST